MLELFQGQEAENPIHIFLKNKLVFFFFLFCLTQSSRFKFQVAVWINYTFKSHMM